MNAFWPSLIAVAVLAAVHLFASGLGGFRDRPRSIWLSIAGGVSVAYVFLHVLPELQSGQRALEEAIGETLGFLHDHIYALALSSLVLYYGLDKLALSSRRRQRSSGGADATSAGVFWLHIGSFTLYNALIGYLLVHREESDAAGLVLFVVAMALHFFVTDHALREHHKQAYLHRGRYIVTAAIVLGWIVGSTTEISEAAVSTLFAFLAGGVILNVLKEELPEERESRFWAFLLGVLGYGLLLLAL